MLAAPAQPQAPADVRVLVPVDGCVDVVALVRDRPGLVLDLLLRELRAGDLEAAVAKVREVLDELVEEARARERARRKGRARP